MLVTQPRYSSVVMAECSREGTLIRTRHWRKHGGKVLDILAEKYPQAYFAGAVALSKRIGVLRCEWGNEPIQSRVLCVVF